MNPITLHHVAADKNFIIKLDFPLWPKRLKVSKIYKEYLHTLLSVPFWLNTHLQLLSIVKLTVYRSIQICNYLIKQLNNSWKLKKNYPVPKKYVCI